MANTTQFSDTTFESANWQLQTVKGGNGGTVRASKVNAAGNPGAFREITNTVNQVSGGVNSNILGFHWKKGATYNPKTQGAIAAIDYSEDTILIQGFGEGQAGGIALLQNGQIYLPVSRFITPESYWTSKQLYHLQAKDFVAIATTNSHPNFSKSGAPIQFGFFRANTTSNSRYSITAGIDNWSVSVRPAPVRMKQEIGISVALILGVGFGLFLLALVWRRTW